MQFLTRIKNSFFADQENWILWLPVFFGGGIIFYFYFPNNSHLFPLALFFLAIFLIIIFKEQLWQLLLIALAIFLAGFLWAKFYTEIIAYTPKIEHKFYATAIGRVDDLNSFYNPILKRNSYQIVLQDVALYRAGSIADDVVVKKEKVKKIKKPKKKKVKKPRKKREKLLASSSQRKLGSQYAGRDPSLRWDDGVKHKHKPKPKKSKRENKTVIKSYLNVSGYQEIDREFLSVDYKSQNKNWDKNIYLNPPKKIILSINTKINDAKIGDIIQARVILEPFKPPYFPGGYDKSFENYFKGIGGGGFAASDLKVLKASNQNSFLPDIKILRQNIARKILDQMDEQSGPMAVALLVGAQNLIKPDVMQAMRNSGLAHLISISGLHFTLAAGIFFFSIRFLLSLNQYLTINYNIKKIAAAIAIFAGFFYLLLADMPIPAIRAFIIIALIFTAILLDLTPNAFRSTAFAALAILIFSPNVIFSVSFQLSFAAILALVALADLLKTIHLNSSRRPIYLKFIFYFLSIILSSLAATIATTPFSIYHFNNFISFGVLANLAAIPITSFITMPCGFLALLLMPFGFEKLALYPMQISINWIIDIANYVATMPHSYLTVKAISPLSFGLIIFGSLWLLLWKKLWRVLGLAPIILGIYLAIKTPIPTLLIDQEKKMVAFYYNQKLIFLKPTKSKQALVWAKKLGLNEFVDIGDLSEEEKQNLQLDCNKNFCEFQLQEKQILVLRGRNKIDEICKKQYNFVVNINQKYQLPKCFHLKSSSQRKLGSQYVGRDPSFRWDDGVRRMDDGMRRMDDDSTYLILIQPQSR
jgi:competence protein ComEC